MLAAFKCLKRENFVSVITQVGITLLEGRPKPAEDEHRIIDEYRILLNF